MFSWLNSNLLHNILNLVILIDSLLAFTGCHIDEMGAAVCAATWIPASLIIPIATLAAATKLIINLTRDGFAGLFKKQPPVVDDMKTVIVPTVKPVAAENIMVTVAPRKGVRK